MARYREDHRSALGVGAVPAHRRSALEPPARRPSLSPRRVRRDATPSWRPASRPVPSRPIDRLLKGGPGLAEFDTRDGAAGRERSRAATTARHMRAWWLYRMLLQPAPAAREADALLAQPLRHQQRQGAERRLHARPVRADAQARPRQLRDAAAGDVARPGHAGLARQPATARRATPTRTTPAS